MRGSAFNWRLPVKGIQCASSQPASGRTGVARRPGSEVVVVGMGSMLDPPLACKNERGSPFTCRFMKVSTRPRGRALLGQLSDMDLRLLRVFKTVVECGGLSAAELELNI